MLGGITVTLLIGLPPMPAPAALMNAFQRIEIETSTDLASTFRLRFGMTQSPGLDWDLVGRQYQDTLFRPFTPVQIRVALGAEIPQAIINGYICGQQVFYDDQGGRSALEIAGLDVTMLMNLQEKVVSWPMTDAEIAQQIFAQYHITPMVSPTLPSLPETEGTTTQRGTDIRFLRRLAQRNGYECFVVPDPPSGTDLGYFGPATNHPAPADAVLNVRMGPDTNVSQFKAPGLGTATQAIVNRSSWAIMAEGTVGPDVSVLRPGNTINVRGVGLFFNGSYYVTRVSHTLERDSYIQKFEAQRNAVTMTGSELFVQH